MLSCLAKRHGTRTPVPYGSPFPAEPRCRSGLPRARAGVGRRGAACPCDWLWSSPTHGLLQPTAQALRMPHLPNTTAANAHNTKKKTVGPGRCP